MKNCRYNSNWKCWKKEGTPTDIECQNCLLGVANTQIYVIYQLLSKIGRKFGYNIEKIVSEISQSLKKPNVKVDAEYINENIVSPVSAILTILVNICKRLNIPVK